MPAQENSKIEEGGGRISVRIEPVRFKAIDLRFFFFRAAARTTGRGSRHPWFISVDADFRL